MPPKEILKYILDIESVVGELEQVIKLHDQNYAKFNSNFMTIRTVERDLEIIGEAIRKITKSRLHSSHQQCQTYYWFKKYDCTCL